MHTSVIFYQMCAILLFLLIGFFVRKRGYISATGTHDMSWLLANICSPAQILSAVLNMDDAPDRKSALIVAGVGVVAYAVMLPLSRLIGRVLHAPKKDHRFYGAIFLFGNIGFLGLPLIHAMYGDKGAAYMTILILEFNLLVFTYGCVLLRKEGSELHVDLKLLINPGVIACLISIGVFFSGIRLPAVFGSIAQYAGTGVTFLATFLIGTNLYGVDLKRLFSDWRMYLYVLIRQVLFPAIFILIVKNFVSDPTALGVLAVFAAVPPGNIVSVIAMNNDCDMDVLTRGTVFSTLLSVATMALVLSVML